MLQLSQEHWIPEKWLFKVSSDQDQSEKLLRLHKIMFSSPCLVNLLGVWSTEQVWLKKIHLDSNKLIFVCISPLLAQSHTEIKWVFWKWVQDISENSIYLALQHCLKSMTLSYRNSMFPCQSFPCTVHQDVLTWVLWTRCTCSAKSGRPAITGQIICY